MTSLPSLSIREAGDLLSRKEISSSELVEACLARIEEKNPALNAFLEVFEDARVQAKEADERLLRGEGTPLTGIPLALKDNILIKGRRVSAASKMLEHYRATYDAGVVEKLRAGGAVFIGRTNMDEFALGGSTENSAFGPTKNPSDEERVAGGTSGGSAAAVAAELALGALGSDTGGSVRNPASYCGIVGLKPTYGSVSRSGLIAAVSSFDQIGPMTKTVADAALLFETIKGKDPKDSTSYERGEKHDRKVGIIGIPDIEGFGALHEGVRFHFKTATERLRGLGFRLVEGISLPSLSRALAAYYVINFAEVSSNLARFDGVRYGLYREGKSGIDDYAATREGFGAEAKRRIILGTHVLSAGYYDAYYGRAVSLRERLIEEFRSAFRDVDVLLTPTMPSPAFRIGEKSNPVTLYLEDLFTVPANLTGMPALSVPMGEVEEGGKKLPVGLQFMAPHDAEASLFGIGGAFLGEA